MLDYDDHEKERLMGTLTIRNMDDAVIDDLKAAASQHNRSLEAEVRDILSRHRTLRRRPTVEELLALADKVAAMTPKVPQTDSVELLRESRGER
jgi:plasmid stability protein